MNNIPNIVIPTIRSKEFMMSFFDAWKDEFKGCHIIIVEDRKEKILSSLLDEYEFLSSVYDWRDIDNDLGENSWIIPRQTDCVRSYGYYKAWQNNPNIIVTLDDDVIPQKNHIETFYKKLYLDKYPNPNNYNTLKNRLPRGTYNEYVGCDVAHGGWLNIPDLSAEEQIKNSFISTKNDFNEGLIPIKSYFSMCGMNLAWKPEFTEHMYFGLQGGKYPIDRCGDIWAGHYISQKGLIVHTGEPFCFHTRESNIWSNLNKEINAEDYTNIFRQVIIEKKYTQIEYFNTLKSAYKIWISLFKK